MEENPYPSLIVVAAARRLAVHLNRPDGVGIPGREGAPARVWQGFGVAVLLQILQAIEKQTHLVMDTVYP